MNRTDNFLANPIQFVGTYALDTMHILPPVNAPQTNFFTVDQPNSTKPEANIKISAQPTNLTAYYLPFNGMSQPASSIIVPKAAPVHNFVFTGALTGCSVIVVDRGVNWEVFHDPIVNASVNNNAYAGLQIAASYEDSEYGQPAVALPRERSAAALMWFNNATNRWIFIGQKQNYTAPGIDFSLVNPIYTELI